MKITNTILLLLVILLGGAAFLTLKLPPPTPTPIQQACTEEARICPDGSAVGRTGPNCEFAPCPTPATSTQSECNQDAKVCPDGSKVGRVGPTCQFAACPSEGATSATIKTSMDQAMTGLSVTITPYDLVSDSRCPSDVQCIWAGTVELKARIATKVGNGEQVFKLGEPKEIGEYSVTLTDVTPGKVSTQQTPLSSYRFTFEVKKL